MLTNKWRVCMSADNSPHSFYIPVMGTGFTIDTPLSVARFGISSVLSLVDDVLIEQMRKFWCEQHGEPYLAITAQMPDARANRITAYLNLLQQLIEQQIVQLRGLPFGAGSDLDTYFEILPDGLIKQAYRAMLLEQNPTVQVKLQDELRKFVVAGSIDVNIMTKLDCRHYSNGAVLPYEFADAAAALRGYANSNVSSYMTLSAGFNPNLYGYMANFPDFLPDEHNKFKKKICLKVSDYRSAAIQGKYLAKRGLWVSQYRVESPLNCGGHAFVNDGHLLGPILEEFKQRKAELVETLYDCYQHALKNIKPDYSGDVPGNVVITAQGGVGTSAEHDFLIKYYGLNAVGWGSPFLLVPEATNVDNVQLAKLLAATHEDVFISPSSPLGVPFWNLRNSSSEEARMQRIAAGVPGSKCVKGFAKSNQEFTDRPICTASREYQRQKLQQLEQDRDQFSVAQFNAKRADVLSKSCICHDLAGGATIRRNIDPEATSAMCPGPNIINFKKLMTLKEMIQHIYGCCSVLSDDERPHVFVREIQLQISYLLQEIKNTSLKLPARPQQKLVEVCDNLNEGIEYYRKIAAEMFKDHQDKFLTALQSLQDEINNLGLAGVVAD